MALRVVELSFRFKLRILQKLTSLRGKSLVTKVMTSPKSSDIFQIFFLSFLCKNYV